MIIIYLISDIVNQNINMLCINTILGLFTAVLAGLIPLHFLQKSQLTLPSQSYCDDILPNYPN
jgi:hypothetical protein